METYTLKSVKTSPCLFFAFCIGIIICKFNEHATYNLNVGSNSLGNMGGSQAWGLAILRWGQNMPTQATQY
jgi:hypothetical protein